MENRVLKNYQLILKNILSYLPSRLLIIINSIIIIPIFAHILETKQMSIYLISIQILNLILTCSYDWITKSVLRFYEKYRLKNSIDSFMSNIFCISVITYFFILSLFIFSRNYVLAKFSIDNLTFLLIIFLVIPCGIRQFLYQILRLKNKPKLYTISIVLYQISFIILFLLLMHILNGAAAILLAMNIAIFLIDIYIMKSILLNYNIKISLDKSLISEILKYALPLILTNSCYWVVLHISKLTFQQMHEYLNTAIIGVSWMLSNSVMQPLLSVFIFAVFPVIIKKFESNRIVKNYFTNIIQLFCCIFIPLAGIFCYFSKEITSLILPQKYSTAAIIIPFFAVTLFLHEFLKLINIKYHLKNKTYVEMIIAVFIAGLTYLLNINLISKYSILGAAIALLVSELILIVINIFTGLKNYDYINYKKIIKTFILTSLTGAISFIITFTLFHNNYSTLICIIKIIMYVLLNIIILWKFKKQILS